MKSDSIFNIKVVDLFDRFPSSQRSPKSVYCATSYDFLKIKGCHELLFIWKTDEVSKLVIEFSTVHIFNWSRQPIHRFCYLHLLFCKTCWSQHMDRRLYTILLQCWSRHFNCWLHPSSVRLKKNFKVGNPDADYEQCLHCSEVGIRFTNFLQVSIQ